MIKVDENDPIGELEPSFPYRDVQIKWNVDVKKFYELQSEIGRGKFGTVYRCKEKATGLTLAAKFVAIARKQDKKNVEREVEIMRELQHPRLIQIYDAFESSNVMCVVLELIEGGELFERVIDDDFVLTEKSCTVFMRQICEGIEFIHSKNILHLDMKPENILCLTKTGNRIKIIDFGLARKFDPSKKLQVLFGTPEFVAPEVVNFDQIGFGTDMWSVGVICYVLLSGLSPFMGETDVATMANVTIALYDFDDEAFCTISEDAKDFIRKLLVKDKEQRLTATQCLQHPWLRRKPPLSKPKLELDSTKDNLRTFVDRWTDQPNNITPFIIQTPNILKEIDSNKPDVTNIHEVVKPCVVIDRGAHIKPDALSPTSPLPKKIKLEGGNDQKSNLGIPIKTETKTKTKSGTPKKSKTAPKNNSGSRGSSSNESESDAISSSSKQENRINSTVEACDTKDSVGERLRWPSNCAEKVIGKTESNKQTESISKNLKSSTLTLKINPERPKEIIPPNLDCNTVDKNSGTSKTKSHLSNDKINSSKNSEEKNIVPEVTEVPKKESSPSEIKKSGMTKQEKDTGNLLTLAKDFAKGSSVLNENSEHTSSNKVSSQTSITSNIQSLKEIKKNISKVDSNIASLVIETNKASVKESQRDNFTKLSQEPQNGESHSSSPIDTKTQFVQKNIPIKSEDLLQEKSKSSISSSSKETFSTNAANKISDEIQDAGNLRKTDNEETKSQSSMIDPQPVSQKPKIAPKQLGSNISGLKSIFGSKASKYEQRHPAIKYNRTMSSPAPKTKSTYGKSDKLETIQQESEISSQSTAPKNLPKAITHKITIKSSNSDSNSSSKSSYTTIRQNNDRIPTENINLSTHKPPTPATINSGDNSRKCNNLDNNSRTPMNEWVNEKLLGDHFIIDRRASDISSLVNRDSYFNDNVGSRIAEEISRITDKYCKINDDEPFIKSPSIMMDRHERITDLLNGKKRPKYRLTYLNRDVPIGSSPPPTNLTYYLTNCLASNSTTPLWAANFNVPCNFYSAPGTPVGSPHSPEDSLHNDILFQMLSSKIDNDSMERKSLPKKTTLVFNT